MKHRLLLLISAVATCLTAWADNTSTSVEQVTTNIELSDDVDYHITSSTPFTTTGSINITNTNHAVVILDNVKPSTANANFLAYIKINGAKAVNNSNCQVRIYNKGALILPYTYKNALTVYSETSCKGDSCSNFDLSNTGGFMNTLTDEQLNNRIKSFRLKRGFMVTFSLKAGGYGYSRCFIADKADLVMNLPVLMAGRVSSYRMFQWQNVSKKGLANNTSTADNEALGTTWCYTFGGAGSNLGLDRECVAHRVHEGWPSISDCGSVTPTAHMKTNNEPANNADDQPATVAQVLANWEKTMATGMRLCSPAQHDGGLSWTRAFMDSIDARGWRCDIVDIHCYWPEWNLENQVAGYYNTYHRPVWISEWLWGASWNKNGIFASSNPDADNATVLKRVLANFASVGCLERYAYWNQESRGHIVNSGTLTAAGEVYKAEDAGLAYNKAYEYVPTSPRVYAPSGMTLSFAPTTMLATIKFTDPNGELNNSLTLERRRNTNSDWQTIDTLEIKDAGGSYTYIDTVPSSGNWEYRVKAVTFNDSRLYSNVVYNYVNGAESLYGDSVQYGTYSTNSTDYSYYYMATKFSAEPAVVFGSFSNANADLFPLERIMRVFPNKNQYNLFRANIYPLLSSKESDFYYIKPKETEVANDFVSYIIANSGTGHIGSLAYEAGKISSVYADQTVNYTFAKPFNDVPVVFTSPIYTGGSYPVCARVCNVTKTGFSVKLMREQSVKDNNVAALSAAVGFVAIEKGKTSDGGDKMLIVGDTTFTFKSSLTPSKVYQYEQPVHNPVVLAQMQSLNHDVMSVLRTCPNIVDTTYIRLRYQIDPSAPSMALTASNPAIERVGWLTIADDDGTASGIAEIKSQGKSTSLQAYPSVVTVAFGVKDAGATSVAVYNMGGQKVIEQSMTDGQTTINATSLPAGMYIVRSNANHSAKIIKK